MNERTEPASYSLIAEIAFAPIYPYLAEQMVEKYGITSGMCVDVGSGPGSLAIALARVTE